MSDLISLGSHLHLDALSFGNVDVLDQSLSPDVVAHFLASGTPSGPEQVKDFCRAVRAVFPDLTYTVDDAIVDGDRIAVRVTGRGTQTGGIGDLPASDKQAQWSEMHFFRVVDDKIVEMWA